MYQLVLLRHGQSVWNLEKKFTGWTDVPLSEQGVAEAHEAGRLLKNAGFVFDEVHTNCLQRVIKTAWIVLEEIDQMWLPIAPSWRLNERHYGDLQGKDHQSVIGEVGEEQVRIWRRSYDVVPPLLDESDERFPGNDRRYSHIERSELPRGESLEQTLDRALPYYIDEIAPKILDGKLLLVVASHNSLRAIVKHIEDLSSDEVLDVEIPTGRPIVYTLDQDLNTLAKESLGV